MSKVVSNISMSLDGYIAGREPTIDEPLGRGGEQLHEWVVRLAAWREPHGIEGGETGPDNEVMGETTANVGAVIMGRKMFSGGHGPWADDPKKDGWWGDNPPFHAPVFILTSHPRGTVEKEGGTSFIFVTDGIDSAMQQARQAAGDKDISIAGGAQTIQQCLNAGYLDELQIHLVPILLGSGTQLFKNVQGAKLEKVRVIDSPTVTHLKYRIIN